ncbi:KAP family P-loop NTPase fold protein [Tritonibacter mobilis]|uniref:KAP family P-loop NTPase fold protein n=1 Tax=Tritonibacter mobilis TaxID=379347 RepID=UPI0008068A19|nr:P-loop NTPase fold protein [Tritonibacter mobilis]
MALVTNEEPEVAWEGDSIGYKEVGETFTTLVKSVKDDTKVISIEAGYGRGKTFFRKHWAEHLRQQDEVVIEIDAHLSDHSGDPVLTFIGALVDALPKGADQRRRVAFEKGKQIVGVLGRTVGGVLAKQGAGAIVDYLSDEFLENVDLEEAAEEQLEKFGDNLSKAAGSMIAAQITAERVRKKGLPAQMNALRDALTGESEESRVIVMVDELDRCHPDYAIAFLEAMKLVFAHKGFVFCLFVNDEYLEGLAAHRFGAMKAGERYLDKFIDIRLKLPDTDAVIAGAAEELFKGLSKASHLTPFGEGDEFTIERAARLAGELAPLSALSMRQIERVKLRVELALRCYPEQPLDYALLVWLAFRDACNVKGREGAEISGKALPISDRLPRFQLIPELAAEFSGKLKAAGGVSVRGFSNDPLVEQELIHKQYRERVQRAQKLLSDQFSGLGNLPSARFRCSSSRSQDWERVLLDLALYYIPEHENVLNALHRLEVAPEDNA